VPARPLSSEQQAQIRATVRELAGKHGLDGWRIADVVNATGVSSRTLYKYFPSKEYLLLNSLLERADQLLAGQQEMTDDRTMTPGERAARMLGAMTAQVEAEPEMTRAMVRALVCGQKVVAPMLLSFHQSMRDMVAGALSGGDPDAEVQPDAEVLQQVWFAALLAWACNIREAGYIDHAVQQAVDLLARRAG
jgi:AcrR family transcriptional regulator